MCFSLRVCVRIVSTSDPLGVASWIVYNHSVGRVRERSVG